MVCYIINEKLEILFFSGKIVTSLAYIFTMEKDLVKIIFGRIIFISQLIFKTFELLWYFLRLLECKRMIGLHFA